MACRRETVVAATALLLACCSCGSEEGGRVGEKQTLRCRDADAGAITGEPWIVRLDPVAETAEFVVHVPQKSVDAGVPAGNRRGRLLASERAYEIDIPSDSGGQREKWFRLRFHFEIDRFSGNGTLVMGDVKPGDVPTGRPIKCEEIPGEPRF